MRYLRMVALLAVLAVVLYPLLWMLSTSFKPQDEIVGSISLLPSDPTLSHYPSGWNSMDVGFARFFLVAIRYRGETPATVDHFARTIARLEPGELAALRVLAAAPDLAQAERSQRAAMLLALADLGANLRHSNLRHSAPPVQPRA